MLSHVSTAGEIGMGTYGAYQGFQQGDVLGGLDSGRANLPLRLGLGR
ncbi:MAG: hypothetical protein K9M57_09255 [Phycisphaerae bacterium]|nr:hypothetical protein [Phycisphaerae bacterium]